MELFVRCPSGQKRCCRKGCHKRDLFKASHPPPGSSGKDAACQNHKGSARHKGDGIYNIPVAGTSLCLPTAYFRFFLCLPAAHFRNSHHREIYGKPQNRRPIKCYHNDKSHSHSPFRRCFCEQFREYSNCNVFDTVIISHIPAKGQMPSLTLGHYICH